jgi:hypothetical protein
VNSGNDHARPDTHRPVSSGPNKFLLSLARTRVQCMISFRDGEHWAPWNLLKSTALRS